MIHRTIILAFALALATAAQQLEGVTPQRFNERRAAARRRAASRGEDTAWRRTPALHRSVSAPELLLADLTSGKAMDDIHLDFTGEGRMRGARTK